METFFGAKVFPLSCLMRYGLHVAPGAIQAGVEEVGLAWGTQWVWANEVLDALLVLQGRNTQKIPQYNYSCQCFLLLLTF